MKGTTKTKTTKRATKTTHDIASHVLKAAFTELHPWELTHAERIEVLVDVAHWLLHEVGVAIEDARDDGKRKAG